MIDILSGMIHIVIVMAVVSGFTILVSVYFGKITSYFIDEKLTKFSESVNEDLRLAKIKCENKFTHSWDIQRSFK